MHAKTLIATLAALTLALPAYAEIKIGFLATLSGPSADVGRDQLDGFQLALDRLGGKFGDQPVRVFREDDQQKPETALAAVSKLLDREKVDVVTGLTFANIFMAVQNRITTTDVPFIGTVGGPSPTAGAQCKPNLFVMSWNSDVPAEAMGKFLADRGIQKITTITANFLGGRDKITGLKRFYKGAIADEIYTPLSQLDFSAELSQIAASRPDAVFAFYPGAVGVAFMRQYQQAGLLGRIPVYTTNTLDGSFADAMGAAAHGAFVADAWTPGSPGAASKEFVTAFERRYGRSPSAYAAFSYDTALLLDGAVRKAGGKVSDRKALVRAISEAPFQSLRGDFRFGRNNYPVQNYHVFQYAAAGAGKGEFKLVASDVLRSHADAYAAQCPL